MPQHISMIYEACLEQNWENEDIHTQASHLKLMNNSFVVHIFYIFFFCKHVQVNPILKYILKKINAFPEGDFI